ncbi:hypothetical protein [Novosphingobium panipatense]
MSNQIDRPGAALFWTADSGAAILMAAALAAGVGQPRGALLEICCSPWGD